MNKVVIRHLSGAKANQIEHFPIESYDELVLGRDPNANVTYDPDQDDLVSRQHAVVHIVKGEKLSFTITDQDSSNGTFLNATRISGEDQLFPGDKIQLGEGGPECVFDVEPRPAYLVARTRVLSQEALDKTMGFEASPTSTEFTEDLEQPPPLAKLGVGRETVERLIVEEHQATSRKWMYGTAALVVLIAVVGGILYYQNVTVKQQAQLAAQQQAELAAQQVALDVAHLPRMTPQLVAEKYSQATVYIEITWRLYDQESGKQIFHKFVGNGQYPAYVKLKDGKIVRWLTTNDEDQTNEPIFGAGSGSGFLVRPDGFILTNKHVAAPWQTPYWYSWYELKKEGRLFHEGSLANRQSFQPTSEAYLAKWTPTDGGIVFKERTPVRIYKQPNDFEGRSDVLNVRFPNSTQSIEARLVRTSPKADVALIKIEVPEDLGVYVDKLAARGHFSKQGEPITVLGYPQVSVQTLAEIDSAEAGKYRRRHEVVPEPTVTEGIIAKIGRSLSTAEGDPGTRIIGTMGHVFQLTINTAGAGNSGGPVFDSTGQVIALFTYQKTGSSGEIVTFAVPIVYAADLLSFQDVTKKRKKQH